MKINKYITLIKNIIIHKNYNKTNINKIYDKNKT